MEPDNIYLPNITDIVFEEFEDEIVVINLVNGYYYSINKFGMMIWELLGRKFSPVRIIEISKMVYPEMKQEVEKLFFNFISGLEFEGIVQKVENGSKAVPATDELISEIRNKYGNQPGEPVLEKYTDQQELLLLDPIHEVSTLGWPDKKGDKSDNE